MCGWVYQPEQPCISRWLYRIKHKPKEIPHGQVLEMCEGGLHHVPTQNTHKTTCQLTKHKITHSLTSTDQVHLHVPSLCTSASAQQPANAR